MYLETFIGLVCLTLAAAYVLIYEINWKAVKEIFKRGK